MAREYLEITGAGGGNTKLTTWEAYEDGYVRIESYERNAYGTSHYLSQSELKQLIEFLTKQVKE